MVRSISGGSEGSAAMSVDEVKNLYAAQYPELATAVVNGPEAVGDKMRYTFERAIGSKG